MKPEIHLLVSMLNFGGCSLPETNSSSLKMDGWNTILSYWVSAYFQVLLLMAEIPNNHLGCMKPYKLMG